MINERVEVAAYLRGENLHHDTEYRTALLLAKYFHEEGDETEPEIRASLIEWAKKYHFFIKASMKCIGRRVVDGNMRLIDDRRVFINQADIDAIVGRFDTYKGRKAALGVLCVAKAYGGGEFPLYQNTLGRWLRIRNQGRRESGTMADYVKWLVALDYIEAVEVGDITSWYNKDVVKHPSRYRLLVPCDNVGPYELVDNDIEGLYDRIFSGVDVDAEVWRDVSGYGGHYQISSERRVRCAEYRDSAGRLHGAKYITVSCQYKAPYVYLSYMGRQEKVKLDELYAAYF